MPLAHPRNSRLSFVLSALVGVLVASVLLAPSSASALRRWCFNDPAFLVEGALLDIEVGVPLEDLGKVEGGVLEVRVPKNVKASLLLNLNLFYKLDVRVVHTDQTWRKGPIPIEVRARVNGAGLSEIKMIVIWQNGLVRLGTATGPANEWLVKRYELRGLLGGLLGN